jgi:hypothetical protein
VEMVEIVCDGFSWIPILWSLFKSVEICMTLFESLMVSESIEISESNFIIIYDTTALKFH